MPSKDKAKTRKTHNAWRGRVMQDPEVRARRNADSRRQYAARRRAEGWDIDAKRAQAEAYKKSPDYETKEREAGRVRYLKRQAKKFKTTIEAVNARIEEMGGACEICRRDLNGDNKSKRNLDHCHDSGMARGTLCGDCNRGLGLFKDNPETLEAAAEYIRHHRLAHGVRRVDQ